jgi:hypothetical protein
VPAECRKNDLLPLCLSRWFTRTGDACTSAALELDGTEHEVLTLTQCIIHAFMPVMVMYVLMPMYDTEFVSHFVPLK